MEHWFDDLARHVARQPRSRRSMFAWAVKLGVAASGVGLFGRLAPDVAASEVSGGTRAAGITGVTAVANAPAAAAPCTVQDTFGALRSLSVSSITGANPMTLTHLFYTEVATGSTASTLTIVPGVMEGATPRTEATLHMSVVSTATQVASANVEFGALYTGTTARRSSFSTDGKTVQGIVDGKETAATPLGSDVRTIRFTDGQPALETPSAPAASTGAPIATPVASPTAPSQRSVQDGGPERGIPRVTPSPQPGGNEQRGTTPSTGTLAVQQAVSALIQQSRRETSRCVSQGTSNQVTQRCTDCQLSCREAWVQCSSAAIQASLASGTLAPSAYLAAAAGTCDAGLQQCFRSCKSSGACCPSYCKGDAACCQSAWGCCPPGAAKTSGKWSKAWPTCPRCGTPPWPAPSTGSTPSSNASGR